MQIQSINNSINFKSVSCIPKGIDKKYYLHSDSTLRSKIKKSVAESDLNYFQNTVVKQLAPLKTEVLIDFNKNSVSLFPENEKPIEFNTNKKAIQLGSDESIVRYPTKDGYFDFKYNSVSDAECDKWDYNAENFWQTDLMGKIMVAKNIAKTLG